MEGLRAIIRRHVALARELADWVEADAEFELMAPVPFGLVCFRWCPAGRSEEELDALNARLLAAVNAGRSAISPTRGSAAGTRSGWSWDSGGPSGSTCARRGRRADGGGVAGVDLRKGQVTAAGSGDSSAGAATAARISAPPSNCSGPSRSPRTR